MFLRKQTAGHAEGMPPAPLTSQLFTERLLSLPPSAVCRPSPDPVQTLSEETFLKLLTPTGEQGSLIYLRPYAQVGEFWLWAEPPRMKFTPRKETDVSGPSPPSPSKGSSVPLTLHGLGMPVGGETSPAWSRGSL